MVGERGNEEDEEERMHKIAIYKGGISFLSVITVFFVAIECDIVRHSHEIGEFEDYRDAIKFADMKSKELGFPINDMVRGKKNKRKS